MRFYKRSWHIYRWGMMEYVYTSTLMGKGCHIWAKTPPAATALHCQHTSCRSCTLLVRLHSRTIALLQLTAALLYRGAALPLLGMPAASFRAVHSWMWCTLVAQKKAHTVACHISI